MSDQSPTRPDEKDAEATSDSGIVEDSKPKEPPGKGQADLLVELWKQTITVQQHFNDLSWRIRGLALTALTFTLGAAAVAAQKAVTVELFGWSIQLSALIASTGLVLWLTFRYVDLRWYHQLLRGAVKHGHDLESALRVYIPAAGLTKTISETSPYPGRSWSTGKKIQVRSAMKMQRFYRVVAVLLLFFAVALQLGASPTDSDAGGTAPPSPTSPRITPPSPSRPPATPGSQPPAQTEAPARTSP